MVRIELSLERPAEAIEKAIWDLDFVAECKLDDRLLSVAIDNDQDAMEAVQVIVGLAESLDEPLSLNAVIEPSLETLFLEITGRSLRDVTAAGPTIEPGMS